MLLKFEKVMDVEKLAEIFLEGEGTFYPLPPCELGLTNIMNLLLLPLSSCTLQSVEVLPLYILTNLDLPNLVYLTINRQHDSLLLIKICV